MASEPDAARPSGSHMLQSTEEPQRLLRARQLAVLRFAVTLDEPDRLNVVALATELDRLGGRRELDDTLHFFRRSSSKPCAAIHGSNRMRMQPRRLLQPDRRTTPTARFRRSHRHDAFGPSNARGSIESCAPTSSRADGATSVSL